MEDTNNDPEKTEAERTADAAPVEPSLLQYEPGDLVTYKAQDGQITGVHADGTYDVQIVEKDGEPKKAETGQPLWYERVPAGEIEAR
jgi:hypothetical protein